MNLLLHFLERLVGLLKAVFAPLEELLLVVAHLNYLFSMLQGQVDRPFRLQDLRKSIVIFHSVVHGGSPTLVSQLVLQHLFQSRMLVLEVFQRIF